MSLAWVDPRTLDEGSYVLTWLALPGRYGLPTAEFVSGVHLGGGKVVLDWGSGEPVVICPVWVLDMGALPAWPGGSTFQVAPARRWRRKLLSDLADGELEEAWRAAHGLAQEADAFDDDLSAVIVEYRRRGLRPPDEVAR